MGTIVRRGDRWRAIIRKRGHRARTKTFIRRTHAERWIRETEVEIERHGFTGQHHDLGALMQRYIAEVGAMKPWTRTHRANLKRFARDVRGTTLAEMTPQWFVDFGRNRKASPATVSQEVAYLSTMLRTAEALWGIQANWPALTKGRDLLRRYKLLGKARERDRRVEGDELERIKAAIRSTLPMSDIIDFAAITAMRVGEITRLRWDDLDTEKKLIVIRDRKHPTEKIGNDQTVPLLGDSMAILLRQPRVDDRIFPYRTDSVTTAFQRARTRIGVKGLRFHDIRHEGISRMFEKGYHIQEVAIVSGHKSWAMLRRYTNLRPESLHAKDVTSTSS